MELNVNTDALVVHANRLEKMHKSALPSAVRGTLNKAVFDVKTNTMQRSADDAFTKREPNFFKANSKFENARGFDVNTMKATVGMTEDKLKGDSNYAVQDLEEQEYGGSISKKTFIPTIYARKGNRKGGLVRANARLSAIKNIINTKNITAKNDNQRFTLAAALAGKGGFVLRDNMLWRIDTVVKTNIRNRRTTFKASPYYSFKSARSVNVKPTGFMKKASLKTAGNMDDYFIAEATRQFEKLR